MENGRIVIELQGVSFEECERYRRTILTMISNGAFNIRLGSATIHFNNMGEAMEVEKHVRIRVNPELAKNLSHVKIEVTKQPSI